MNFIRIFNNRVRLSNIIVEKYNNRIFLTTNAHQLQPNGKLQQNNEEDYTPIYKFPYIKLIATVNKVKINHIIASAVAIPVSLGLYFSDIVSSESVIAIFVLAVSGTTALSVFSFVTNKWIGFVYLNKNRTKMKISYVDFWGKRKDAEFPLDDITPLSEIRATPLDAFFQTLRRYSTNEQFKFNKSVGLILDKELFYKAFR